MNKLAPTPSTVLSPQEIRSVMMGLMLAIILGAIEQTIVSVALPRMAAQLQGTELLAWVVSGYLLALAVSTPIYGKLGDLYGRRSVLSLAICVFVLASVACALAQSMPQLIFARIVQGIGGGGLISVAQAIVADVVIARERGRYQGYISGAYALASVSGPVLGGLLTQYLSWRWIFWINVPLGLATLFITRRTLARLAVPQVSHSIDTLGALLLSASLSALLVGITRVGQGAPWLDPASLQLFALGAALLVAFAWQEQRAVEPLIPLSMFRHRTVVVSCALLFIVFFEMVALTTLIPLRLQMSSGAGVERAALELLPLTLAVPMAAMLCGRMMLSTGRYRPLQLAGAAIVPPAVLALALVDARATLPTLLFMAAAGLGMGLQLPSSMVAVQNAVPSGQVGVATAVTALFRALGAAMGIAILTAFLLASLRDSSAASVLPHGGVDVLKHMLGQTLAKTDALGQTVLAVDAAFRKVFMIAAGVALVSFALAMSMADETLGDER
jgi:EmrB/QacA subfamily drug resistance transporter